MTSPAVKLQHKSSKKDNWLQAHVEDIPTRWREVIPGFGSSQPCRVALVNEIEVRGQRSSDRISAIRSIVLKNSATSFQRQYWNTGEPLRASKIHGAELG